MTASRTSVVLALIVLLGGAVYVQNFEESGPIPDPSEPISPAAQPRPEPPAPQPSPHPIPHNHHHLNDNLQLLGVSEDGNTAIVQVGAELPQPRQHHPAYYERVDVRTNELLDRWEEPVHRALPAETANDDRAQIKNAISFPHLNGEEHLRELRLHRDALLSTTTQTTNTFAVHPDGQRIAYNAGDSLILTDGEGRAVYQAPQIATYSPSFSPDGRWLAMRGYAGTFPDGSGKYLPYLLDLKTMTLKQLRTYPNLSLIHWATDSRSIFVTDGDFNKENRCLFNVPLDPSQRPRKIFCAEENHTLEGVVFSPKKTIALASVSEDRRTRRIWFRPSTGEVIASTHFSGWIQAMNEEGVLLVSDHLNEIVDPLHKQRWRFKQTLNARNQELHGAGWISSTELVALSSLGIQRINIETTERIPLSWED